MSTATIHVNRTDKEYADRYRPRKVVIDGEVVGRIREGETLDFEVPTGKHEVFGVARNPRGHIRSTFINRLSERRRDFRSRWGIAIGHRARSCARIQLNPR